ncbi:MFS transporter [Microbacterium sp. cx-59]|uniref:MFS transporter n=1 Tax=Microbacterium sp. cx-59 TaxID=2891207 RepID=UPI001E453031|nr:MFS transporter [Microbacterium sp. cx-59]MCC4908926.1 MFS transporter [Microbacterium sp. cx-59]
MTVPVPATHDPAAQDSSVTRSRATAFAPFTVRIFRILWLASLVSNIGGWMQSVGAQWFLIEGDSSPALVALVQTAAAAPVILLAIPAGVLGELLNRRRVLIATQLVQVGVVAVLVGLTWQDALTPGSLLAATLALGVVSAIQLPAYEAIVPDIVPKPMIADAAALSSTGINLARAVGPALAGLVAAQVGLAAVFALNALSFVFFLIVLVAWRGYRPPPVRAEPFLDASRAGLRYVRHSAIVRKILVRFCLFLLPANALWALLPVVAAGTLGLSAAGYGLLLGALGVGSLLGATVLGKARARLGVNGTVMWGSAAYGAGLILVVVWPTLWVTIPVLLVTGAAWIAVVATVNGTIQAFLPVWVRTRGLSIYQLAFYGPTAVSAVVLGVLADRWGSEAVMVVAGGLTVLLAVSQVIWRLPETQGIGREIVPIPGETIEHLSDEDDAVLVLVHYTVAPTDRAEFVRTMAWVEQARLRTGARAWRLYRDPARDDRLVEAFTVGSWREHLSQHEARTTEYDGDLLDRARALSVGVPTVDHLVVMPRPHHPRHPSNPTDRPPL